MLKATLPLLFLLILMAAADDNCAAQTDVTWHDATEFEIEGRGWTDTESTYDRLPKRAKGVVPGGVWGLGKHSAGICVRFQTNARSVSVRWDVINDTLAMPHMPATGVSGVDLYRRSVNGGWEFVQNGRPTGKMNNHMTANLPAAGATKNECLVYFPLYNGVSKVEIGTPPGSVLTKAAPRPEAKRMPVVYYGTSIAQGGCASRPGMAHVAILGRLLDRPMINLGFSGSGKMEPEVARFIAELDPALFVIDCLWNIGGTTGSDLSAKVATLVDTIRQTHPDTPILFVGQSVIHVNQAPSALEKLQEKAVQQLREKGVKHLHTCPGKNLLGSDGEGTVDGVHPNDLGMRRHADALAPVLERLLRSGS
jgi:hypothetical protein